MGPCLQQSLAEGHKCWIFVLHRPSQKNEDLGAQLAITRPFQYYPDRCSRFYSVLCFFAFMGSGKIGNPVPNLLPK